MPSNNYQKIVLEIDAIDSTMQSKLEKIKNVCTELEKSMQQKLTSFEELKQEYVLVNEKYQDLVEEEDKLAKSANSSSDELQILQEQYDNTEKKISGIKHTKITSETDLSKAQLKNRELINEIEMKKALLNKVESDIEAEIKDAEENINQLDRESAEILNTAQNRENMYKIFKILLDEEYVRDNIYDVIKIVEQPGVDSIDKLQRTSAVSLADVKQAVMMLKAKGYIDVDNEGGYSIIRSIDI